jgi:arylsulfatase
VVLVSIDTLRADRLGTWGNQDGLTPNLDRFASEATAFTRAYSQANHTAYSHASILTGRYASELGTLDNAFQLAEGIPTLAGVLGAYGWHTGAAVGGAFLAPSYGLDRGFDHYDPTLAWASLQQTVPSALAWLDTLPAGDPFLLFVHGYDPHSRYLKPTPWGYGRAEAAYEGPARMAVRELNGSQFIADSAFTPRLMLMEKVVRENVRFGTGDPTRAARALGVDRQRMDRGDMAHVAAAYDGAVTWADAWFGVLMAELRARDVLDRALVVVLSDHGEELGENGLFDHRFFLSDEDLHVPLMVRLPGGAGGGRTVDELVELTDVLPTILSFAGASPPAGARGRSLLPATRGEPTPPKELAFSESGFRAVSARSAAGRLTFTGMSPQNPWLVAAARAIPIDSAGWEGARDPALREGILAWREGLRVAGASGTAVPDELAAELRAHGYWGLDR